MLGRGDQPPDGAAEMVPSFPAAGELGVGDGEPELRADGLAAGSAVGAGPVVVVGLPDVSAEAEVGRLGGVGVGVRGGHGWSPGTGCAVLISSIGGGGGLSVPDTRLTF